jgi:hypothetical protein
MAKKYLVTLAPEERQWLAALLSAGQRSAPALTRARILLKADQATGGPAWEGAEIAQAPDRGLRTVERVRRRFVERGPEQALGRKPQRVGKATAVEGPRHFLPRSFVAGVGSRSCFSRCCSCRCLASGSPRPSAGPWRTESCSLCSGGRRGREKPASLVGAARSKRGRLAARRCVPLHFDPAGRCDDMPLAEPSRGGEATAAGTRGGRPRRDSSAPAGAPERQAKKMSGCRPGLR